MNKYLNPEEVLALLRELEAKGEKVHGDHARGSADRLEQAIELTKRLRAQQRSETN